MKLRRRNEIGQFLNDARLTGSGVEVGVHYGKFAATILDNWEGAELYLVDLWQAQQGEVYADVTNERGDLKKAKRAVDHLAATDPRAKVLQLHSVAAANHFDDNSLDFVYIDANHSYAAVRADLEAWWPKLKPGGLFAGHDYRDALAGSSLLAAKPAVDRFCRQRGYVANQTLNDGPHFSWWIRKRLGSENPFSLRLITGYDEGMADIGPIAEANKQKYALRQSCSFHCATAAEFDPDVHPSWSKVQFIRKALDHFGWVFWSDADSLIMNPNRSLMAFMNDAVDVIVCDDRQGINCGQILVRSSDWSKRFFDDLWFSRRQFPEHPWEQEAVIERYENDAETRRRLMRLSTRAFNAFPRKEFLRPQFRYHEGDFLIHFAGTPDPTLRAALMNDYAVRAEDRYVA